MMYKDMIVAAREDGSANENTMWSSIARVDRLLEELKTSHPDMYWRFMRGVHEDFHGKHYDEAFAKHDVSKLRYTDADGDECHGEYWDVDECIELLSDKTFADGVNKWDKYVALNAAHADFCKRFAKDDIINICYMFYFDDEDWKGDDKIWRYMFANYN